MQKYISMTCFFLIVCLLCGCDFTPYSESLANAQEACFKAFTAISEQDTDTLYALICDENKEDLKPSIHLFSENIDGNIISHGDLQRIALPVHFVYDSPTYSVARFQLGDIITDTEKHYTFLFYYGIGNKDYARKRGLQKIILYDGEPDVAHQILALGEVMECTSPKEIPEHAVEIDPDHILSETIADEYASNLLYALRAQDKDCFISLFGSSQKSMAESDFDRIMNFFDGQISTYHIIDFDKSETSTRDGYFTKLTGSVTVYDIMTDTGNLYEICFTANFVERENTALRGITQLEIRHVENALNDVLGHNVIDEIIFTAD